MLVTVRDDVAVKVAGDPDHPITAGALCAKVNDYVERVYSPDRLLQPLVRSGAKGSGEFRPVTWAEALDLVAGRLARDRVTSSAARRSCRTRTLGTFGFIQRDLMSARVMHALGATELDRTVCADAGAVGVIATNGVSSEVDPEQWPNARYIVVWAWNPLSTAPHLWRMIMKARKAGARLVVIDPYDEPHRACRRRACAADAGHRCRAGTRDDACDGRRRLSRRRLVSRPRRPGTTSCSPGSTSGRSIGRAEVCGVDAETIRRLGVEFATTQPSLVRLGVGGSATSALRSRTARSRASPALAGSWRRPGGGMSYLPIATLQATASDSGAPTGRPPAGPGAHDQHVGARRRPHRSRARPAGEGPRVLEQQPGPDRARRRQGARRPGPRRPVHRRARAVHDRHRPLRRRRAAGDDAARAPRRGAVMGSALYRLQRAGHRAASATRSRTPRSSDCSPSRLGLDDPCFSETDAELLDEALVRARRRPSTSSCCGRGDG